MNDSSNQPDGYYDEPALNDGEIDLSFLDEEKN